MLHQVRHVFIGKVLGPGDGTLTAVANNEGARDSVFLVNPAGVPDTPNSYIITADSADTSAVQVAMFKKPGVVGDKALITSPIFNSSCAPVSLFKYSLAPRETVLCDFTSFNFFDISGGMLNNEEINVLIRFNNVFDLSPGQKYMLLPPMLVKTDGSNKITTGAIAFWFSKFIKVIENHKYLSKFLTAEITYESPTSDATGTASFKLTAKDVEYSYIQRYPYEPIEFDVIISRANGEPLVLDRGKPGSTSTRAMLSSGDPRVIMGIEKEAQGYRGVTNFTAFPPVLPAIRTLLNAGRYSSFIWNVSRPYHDPTDALRLSSETVEMYMLGSLEELRTSFGPRLNKTPWAILESVYVNRGKEIARNEEPEPKPMPEDDQQLQLDNDSVSNQEPPTVIIETNSQFGSSQHSAVPEQQDSFISLDSLNLTGDDNQQTQIDAFSSIISQDDKDALQNAGNDLDQGGGNNNDDSKNISDLYSSDPFTSTKQIKNKVRKLKKK